MSTILLKGYARLKVDSQILDVDDVPELNK